jgi:hypothetical protein
MTLKVLVKCGWEVVTKNVCINKDFNGHLKNVEIIHKYNLENGLYKGKYL